MRHKILGFCLEMCFLEKYVKNYTTQGTAGRELEQQLADGQHADLIIINNNYNEL